VREAFDPRCMLYPGLLLDAISCLL
jgi:hypothetical protein